MPLTLIRIENVNHKWIAEVELGGLTAWREVVRDDDFDGMLRQISAVFHKKQGTEDPLSPYWSDRAAEVMLSQPKKPLVINRIGDRYLGEDNHGTLIDGPVPMLSNAELYANAGTTAETADADRERSPTIEDINKVAVPAGERIFGRSDPNIPQLPVWAPHVVDAMQQTEEVIQARASLDAQAAEQAPWGRKKDGTPKKRPGRNAA